MLSVNRSYEVTEVEYESERSRYRKSKDVEDIWTVIEPKTIDERAYTYDEAIEITGNGKYNIGLLISLVVVILGMGLDMFGFSLVVKGSVCELELTNSQTGILVSIPFIGPIIMSYVWGYVSDTKGRRRCLVFSLYVSCVVSILGAFSPNWIVLAVLKLITCCFSCCAQSVSYALLSESCPEQKRGPYMLVMTSMLMLNPCTYFFIGYIVLNLEFSYDLGYFFFTPWRLIALILAAPLGVGAICTSYFYESPKFMLNVGREEEAIEALNGIWERNGGTPGKYPVQRLVLNEDGNVMDRDASMLKSLWQQTAPLFKPPLLWRTMMLFYLTTVMYSTNNSFSIWFPFLVNAFFESYNSGATGSGDQGLCSAIISSNNKKLSQVTVECNPGLDFKTAMSSIAQSVICTILNLIIARFSHKKKFLMISILAFSGASAIGTMVFNNNLISLMSFIGLLFCNLCIGLVFCYFIELYPTSFRGMAACLGVMVARGSALGGIVFVGAYTVTHCSTTFYSFSALLFSGAFLSFLLPPDKPKNV